MKILNTKMDEQKKIVGFSAIPPERAREIWPSIEHHAEMALQHSFDNLTPRKMLEWILTDRLILVVVTVNDRIEASLTLDMYDGKHGKVCHLMTLAGENMHEWLSEWYPVWERIAREQGADFLTMKGRKGWERVSRPYGFEHQYTQMTKDIRPKEMH